MSNEELRSKALDLEKKAKEYNAIISKKNNELNVFKDKVTREFYINLCLYSIKMNQYNENIKKEFKKINKKELSYIIDSFNYFYDSSLKINNVLKNIE